VKQSHAIVLSGRAGGHNRLVDSIGNEGHICRFAVSNCVYAPGLISLKCDGSISWDPKSDGAETTINLWTALGKKQVEFEELLLELEGSDVKLKGPETTDQMTAVQALQAKEYAKTITNLGNSIAEKLKSGQ